MSHSTSWAAFQSMLASSEKEVDHEKREAHEWQHVHLLDVGIII
ncbi:hypothetical protein K227x_32640 [Rubripirellula lacrimiformis]|uniref:Uncharacterized protein n=1 Tax=Rubripirellula lacrimiformis TaxID=1930273 RepID=A0A517NCK0_9BACT|nr:hypothetical protein [Rubripirellula lacrimiformis]QDT04867.1 hypothetical protein K227x_32640 [Rubripirellula lacrimiformis]